MSDKSISTHDAMSQASGSRYFVLEHHPENGTLLGFWLYLMSDCLIFACLFAFTAWVGPVAAAEVEPQYGGVLAWRIINDPPALDPAQGLTAQPLRGMMDFHRILLGH